MSHRKGTEKGKSGSDMLYEKKCTFLLFLKSNQNRLCILLSSYTNIKTQELSCRIVLFIDLFIFAYHLILCLILQN